MAREERTPDVPMNITGTFLFFHHLRKAGFHFSQGQVPGLCNVLGRVIGGIPHVDEHALLAIELLYRLRDCNAGLPHASSVCQSSMAPEPTATKINISYEQRNPPQFSPNGCPEFQASAGDSKIDRLPTEGPGTCRVSSGRKGLLSQFSHQRHAHHVPTRSDPPLANTWNLDNRFTGWMDVDLTPTGIAQAQQAGKLLTEAGFEFDQAYTSVLKRAIHTLWHCPAVRMDRPWLPTQCSWRLNERHYGGLQGTRQGRDRPQVRR